MIKVVLDASALLAALNGEPGADLVFALLPNGAASSVNIAEVASKIAATGAAESAIQDAIGGLGCIIEPFDGRSAIWAGALYPITKAAGLSLGDRACLSLARALGVPALTADRGWKKVAQDFDIQFIR